MTVINEREGSIVQVPRQLMLNSDLETQKFWLVLADKLNGASGSLADVETTRSVASIRADINQLRQLVNEVNKKALSRINLNEINKRIDSIEERLR